MAMRLSRGWMMAFVLIAYLPIVGCNAPVAPPAGADTAAEDHDHDHADAEHDHEHGDEHADTHAHGDHDHEHANGDHPHPETYAAAVAELDKLRTAVETASASDELSKADDDVHEIGHLLEDVGALAAKEPFGADVKAEISAAVEDLMDAFEQVDAKTHGGGGKAYSDVAEKINAAMTVLKANVAGEK